MKKWFLFLVLLFLACTSNEDILYSNSDSTNISIFAKVSLELDSINKYSKCDTVQPNDTLTFIAEITPSRSIRIQKYFWTLDGKKWANDFSFRKNISKAGHHEVSFILVDYFGDTLSDTLHIWVGNPPLLNDSNYIPLSKTQSIPYENEISFVWNAFDPDSIFDLHYHFVLTDLNNTNLVDTILKKPFFTHSHALSPLNEYSWQVTAFNELNMKSSNSILGLFYTKGINGESGIIGNIQTSNYNHNNSNQKIDIVLSIIDSTNKKLITDTISGKSNNLLNYKINPIPAGNYKLIAKTLDSSEYTPDTSSIILIPNEVLKNKLIILKDTIKPLIKGIPCNSDTLDYLDSLKFIINDNFEKLFSNQINVLYENTQITDKVTFKNDTLIIPSSTLTPSIRVSFITIKAKDLSNNETSRTFYIKPSLQWFITNSDTTLFKNENLDLFIKDTNPYGLKPDSFYFYVNINEQEYISDTTDSSEYRIKLPYNKLNDSINYMRSGIRYTNGLQKWTYWKVFRKFSTRSENE